MPTDKHHSLKPLSKRLMDLIFPPQCPVSGDVLSDHGFLSGPVWQSVNFIAAPFCQRCGIPFLVAAAEGAKCAACLAPDSYENKLISDKGLDHLRAVAGYDERSSSMVLGLKYADRHEVLETMVQMLQKAGKEYWEHDNIELVPVPLHRSRLQQRRFNQAALLAQRLATLIEVDVGLQTLKRRRATPQQQGLTAKARRRNVQGAFEVREQALDNIGNKHFVLIDDVLTTGSTMIECAKALKRAGASKVGGLVFARVVKDEIIAI